MGVSCKAVSCVKIHCVPDLTSNMPAMVVHILLVLLGCTVLISARSQPGAPGFICSEAHANTSPLVGAYTPQCTSHGYYKAKQFHASTGYSWCVTLYGKDIVNTMRGPGEEEPDCTGRPKPVVTCQTGPGGIPSSTTEGTSGPPCLIARINTADLPGAYMPQCTLSVKDMAAGMVDLRPVGAPGSPGRPIGAGTFKAKQCHASTGYCWCADRDGGTKIAGTEKASWEGEPDC